MRSALICGFFILIIQELNGAHDDFRPTPIPLTDWHDRRHGRASTLHETFRTDTPPTVAAVPAHYWEDALRHSVYLTLVRDKIDQLIAKGEVISAENDHHKPVSKEVDDHDLWEKIKSAPFDRIKEEEPSVVGDVTIMAKGRLLEEKGGFRFTEDDKTQDKCKDEYCMQGVKAVWSVKRVRQRDQEMSPGRYHYELTFSVISQPPTKKKKPYENPIRTFTVRESPSPVVPLKAYDIERIQPPHHTPRPARAIWFHKNIVPPQQRIKSKPYGALDRIFSSLFSDDDDSSYEPPATKYKPNPYIQHSKVGYVGSPSDQHQQINPSHHYRPPPVKYNRPPHGSQPNTIQQQHHQQYQQQQEQHQPQQQHNQQQQQQYQQQQEQYQPQQKKYQPQQQKYQPQHHPYQPQQHQYQVPQVPLQQPQHQHYDVGPSSTFGGHGHYNSHDRRIDPYSTVKSTRPSVLPTPLPPLSTETTVAISFDSSENTTNLPDFTPHKTNNRFKPTTNKLNYFSDHVRPPIYNAPPGVFVTMDKKPFKPMPPLKLMHTNKGHKTNRPVDFRPSPQLHENQPIEEDSFTDSAFRPITVHYANSSLIENFESNKKPEHKHRKTTSHGKKPLKKHNVKSRVSSTTAPEIITAQSLVDDDMDAMYWTNVLNSFTKTTPMASQVEKDNVSEETTPLITSTQETDDKIAENITTTTTTTTPYLEVISLSTTPKPVKRTRPMLKYSKPDKIRKHKRITSTSTSTTTTAIPTRGTTFKSTDKPVIRKTVDLIPQASSAPMTSQKNKTSTSTSSTISTTTTTITTTSAPTTTTTKASTTAKSTSTTTEKKQSSTTTLARNRNRFRQSTLFLKGTSIKHDRWSVIGIQKNNTTLPPSAASSSYRRKGSNFQGYSSTTPRNAEKVEASTSSISKFDEGNFESSTNYEKYESNSVIPLVQSEEENDIEGDDEATTNDSSDESEYVFQTTTSAIDRSSDVTSFEDATGDTVSQAPQKSKCKKKKNNQDSEKDLGKEIGSGPFVTTAPTTTTSETETTNDILSEIFKFNFDNDIANDTKTKPDLDSQASIQQGSYHKMDNDLKDFLDILNDKHDDTEDSFDDHYGDDDTEFEDVEDREDDNDDEVDDDSDTYDSDSSGHVLSRQNKSSKPKKPFSFLDLLV